MALLILLRHGQSMWNAADRFTGWVDVPLSEKGIQEALSAGQTLSHTPIDIVFTSNQCRAQQTAMIAMSQMKQQKTPIVQHLAGDQYEQYHIMDESIDSKDIIPVYYDSRLNERFYGQLQGKNKAQCRESYGEEQVKIWRRSYDTPPPEGESLAMTLQRTLPCFDERIMPLLAKGSNILVSAHGNSLRSLAMKIENLNQEEVLNLEIATGKPICYVFEDNHFELTTPST